MVESRLKPAWLLVPLFLQNILIKIRESSREDEMPWCLWRGQDVSAGQRQGRLAAPQCSALKMPSVGVRIRGWRAVHYMSSSESQGGLPWWSSGKESICQRRGHWFHRWPGKSPRAARQRSPCTTTAEPVLHRKRSHRSENPSTATREQACLPNLKKACAAMKTEHCQKKKKCPGDVPVGGNQVSEDW